MRFTNFILGAVVASVANAIVQLTNSDFSGIAVGKPFTITWTGATSSVTLLLKSGPSSALVTAATIASGLSGTSFTWTPSGIASGTYAIEIDSGSEVNYSIQFAVTGGTSVVSTTASSTHASTTTAVSSTTTVASTTASSTTRASSTSSASGSSTTGSTTSASKTSATSSSSSTVPTTNAAAQYGSPFALVALGLVAIAGLN